MPSKLKYSFLYNSEENGSEEYNFVILNNKGNLTFTLENLESCPTQIYELQIEFIELRKQNQNLMIFHDAEKLMAAIKKCIDSNKYAIWYDKNESSFIFEMKNEIFDNGVMAKLKLPEKEQNLESKVKCLTKIINSLRSQLKKYKNDKEEAAVNSFQGTSILNNEEKKLISKWIDPKKTIKFYLLFSTVQMVILPQPFMLIVMEYFQLLQLFWIPLEINSEDILHKIGLNPQLELIIVELHTLSFSICQIACASKENMI